MKNLKNRKIVGLSLNPEELDVLELLMTRGGYTSFSEFAKGRLFGSATESENRLKALELEISNLRDGYERHHKLWVETVKKVANTDTEPLLAALYLLTHKMAGQQVQTELGTLVDVNLVEQIAAEGSYRPASQPEEVPVPKESFLDRVFNPYQQGKEDARRNSSK